MKKKKKKFLPYPLFPHLFSSFCPVNNFLKNGKHVQRTFQTYEASKRWCVAATTLFSSFLHFSSLNSPVFTYFFSSLLPPHLLKLFSFFFFFAFQDRSSMCKEQGRKKKKKKKEKAHWKDSRFDCDSRAPLQSSISLKCKDPTQALFVLHHSFFVVVLL